MSNKPETVREARIYDSVADFPPAAEYGVGPVRDKNGIEYWSDRSKYTKTASSVSEASIPPDTIEKTRLVADYIITGQVFEDVTLKASSDRTLKFPGFAGAGNQRIQKNNADLKFDPDAATSPLLMSLYIDGVPTADTNLTQTELWLSNETGLTATNRSKIQISTGATFGWNTVVIEKNAVASTPFARPMAQEGTAAVDLNNTVNSFRIDVIGSADRNRIRSVDAFFDGYRERPKVCVTFDDGYDSAYLIGYKEARKRNIKTSQFLIFDFFGISNVTHTYQTLAQVEQMKSDPSVYLGVHGAFRWDGAGSGAGKDPYTEIMRNINGLKTLGVSDCLYGAWPEGEMATQDRTIALDKAKAAGLRGCRSTHRFFQSFYTFNPLAIKGIGLSSGTTLAQAKLAIDYAIAWGVSICFYGHKLSGVADGLNWVTADYLELLDYIALKRSLGLIDDVRFDEYVEYGYQTTVLDDPLNF